MSVDTYVYAMVGVHCRNVRLSVTKSRVRGCDHPEVEATFCAVCGALMWVENEKEHYASDQLEHLQEWYGDEDGEVDESAISMIYSPMCGPTEFVVGRVLGEHSGDDEGGYEPFNVLTGEEYTAAYDEIKAALEPLGLWDPEKFGYLLYAISM